MLPLVTIIGRPNVGKSTLFNALAGKRKAIVSDISGTTRDSLTERIDNQEQCPFLLVDTAGLTDDQGENLEKEIQTQASISIEKANLILFVVDGKKELTLDDQLIIERLRKSKVPTVFIANKIDDGNPTPTYELAKHGLGMPLIISAKNYTNIWELQDEIEAHLQKAGFSREEETIEEDEEDVIKVAFVGRPNVGKSSLFNAFLKDNRSVVSNVSGTTRDTIDTPYTDEDGQKYLFLDTAGLRKPGKIGRRIEFWSSVRTTQAIERADVCILLIDALDGVTHQDLAIAGKIEEAGKGIIIGVNKFDLVREQAQQKDESDEREVSEVKMWGESVDKIRNNYHHYLQKKISFLPWAPASFFSAKTGRGIHDILGSVKGIQEERHKRVPTSQLNGWVKEVYYDHVIPSIGTKRGKIKYVTQTETAPPRFQFFVNNQRAFHFTYRRYLENRLREKYGFFGTPIRIELKDAMDYEKRRGRE